MRTFYNKESYSFKDIKSLIDNMVEESINLEFKACGALSTDDKKKIEISKDVAAFANSDGGIIIYGIEEADHKASSFSFIDGNKFTKEWLEHVINSSIQRRIEGIEVIPIRVNNLIENSVYLVKVPRSLDTPHISKDKRFYKRFNFESVPMEEYEVRGLYNRKAKSKLSIDRLKFGIEHEEVYNPEFHVYRIEIDIFNEGEIPEPNYKVNFIFDNFKSYLEISWDEVRGYLYTTLGNESIKISANSSIPIFPNETQTVMRIRLKIPKKLQEDVYKMTTYRTILLYANGEDELTGDISEFKSMIQYGPSLPTQDSTP